MSVTTKCEIIFIHFIDCLCNKVARHSSEVENKFVVKELKGDGHESFVNIKHQKRKKNIFGKNLDHALLISSVDIGDSAKPLF